MSGRGLRRVFLDRGIEFLFDDVLEPDVDGQVDVVAVLRLLFETTELHEFLRRPGSG